MNEAKNSIRLLTIIDTLEELNDSNKRIILLLKQRNNLLINMAFDLSGGKIDLREYYFLDADDAEKGENHDTNV